MTQDDHRAPPRLSSQRRRPVANYRPPARSRPATTSHDDWDDPVRASGEHELAREEDAYYQRQPESHEPPRNGHHHYQATTYEEDYAEEDNTAEPEEDVRYVRRRPLLPSEDLAVYEPAGVMSIKERHQLLTRTIALYDKKWQLAGIKADERRNLLIAYLVPSSRPMDINTAYAKNRLLIVAIDDRGNTHITPPRKASLWRRLAAWIVPFR